MKAVEHEDGGDTHCNWCTWNGPQRLGKGAGRVGNWRTNRDHPNYSTFDNGRNTEKSPGDLRGLAVHQTPVNDHQLTLI